MNRIWVRLWLGIMAAFGGAVVAFELAKLLVRVFSENSTDNFIATWGSVGGVVLSALLAGLIAWYLARPLSAVSKAARQVAGGDLSARALLPTQEPRGPGRGPGGEAVRLVDDFNAMAASLERLEAERQATAAAIAHELRTPLAVLQARLAALRDGVFPLEAREVGLLAQQTDLLARLVEDLRHLSLADAGRLTLDLQPCDLAALVRDVVAGFEPRAAAQGVRLDVRAQAALVTGDAARLRQVVGNLLDNALRFTPAAGTVEVTVCRDEAGVTLLIRDSGPGLGESDPERVFGRFYRADARRSGSGLGLAVVRSLVELHGGRAEAVNSPSGGALFRVLLPPPRTIEI